MGKRYKTELHILNDTYQWALGVPLDSLRTFVTTSNGAPLVAIGSGGSLTAAHLAASLHASTGSFAKAVTPLELTFIADSLRDSSVLILTGGGRNSDILASLEIASSSEPMQLLVVCMRPQSPIAERSRKFRYVQSLSFDPPSGRDGFLAVNSLIGLSTILIRGYESCVAPHGRLVFPTNLPSSIDSRTFTTKTARRLLDRTTWIILYGGWGFPAAVDAESKLTEAALENVQLADFRNFAHGRHYWLAERGHDTGIIALITPSEKELARKTLRLLPREIPILQLETEHDGPIGSLHLLSDVMHLVGVVGTYKGIDPGRPGVPPYGRRLYHARSLPKKNERWVSEETDASEMVAIIRKSGYSTLRRLNPEELEYWRRAYRDYVRNLEAARFGSVVLDYDGTLCDSTERFGAISRDMVREIVRLLSAGVLIGVATGRGKSVQTVLQQAIPKRYWDQVLIGYYNGADIGSLRDPDHPNRASPLDSSLELIREFLEQDKLLGLLAHCEYRPQQITLEPTENKSMKQILARCQDLISKMDNSRIQIVESSHSVDLIAPGVSKRNLVLACMDVRAGEQAASNVLTIGDRGEWPGNDASLLSTPYSLSVDRTSPDPNSCWNLAPAGHRGTQATLDYFSYMQVGRGTLQLKLGKRPR